MAERKVFSVADVAAMVAAYESGATLENVGREFGVERHLLAKKLKESGVNVRRRDVAMDLTGHRYGRLEVLRRVGHTKNNGSLWECRCDCGRMARVSLASLRSGNTKSCGCFKIENQIRLGEVLNKGRKLPPGESLARHAFSECKVNAKKRGIEWMLSEDEFRRLVAGPCSYCGVPYSKRRRAKGYNGEFVCSGIDRVNSSLPYEIGNCVPCCWTCNVAKASMGREEFLEWVGRVYRYSIEAQR